MWKIKKPNVNTNTPNSERNKLNNSNQKIKPKPQIPLQSHNIMKNQINNKNKISDNIKYKDHKILRDIKIVKFILPPSQKRILIKTRKMKINLLKGYLI